MCLGLSVLAILLIPAPSYKPNPWSSQHHTHNGQAVRLRAQCKSLVVGCHYEIYARHLFPKQSCRKVNSIEGPELGRHRLRGSIKHSGFDVHHLERGDNRQDRRSPLRDLRVRKVRPQSQAVQAAQTFGPDQRARHSPFDLPPFG